jgi:putative PIN family toxin of toxin-antitoxin system
MTLGPLVVDTNVIVAGLIGAEPPSPPARILDALLSGRLPYLLSVALLAEYRAVLLRPRIARHHRLDAAQVDCILEQLALNAMVVEEPGPSSPAPDSQDQHLWDLMHSRSGAVLVTGDRRLLLAEQAERTILSPAQFLRQSAL